MKTDRPVRGHPWPVQRVSPLLCRDVPAAAGGAVEQPCFAELYEAHFAFVWRSAKRLGVNEASLDDVVQDVFVTAYRKLSSFEGRSSARTWLFGILRRVVKDRRRGQARRPTEPLWEEPAAPLGDGPFRAAEQAAARDLVQRTLASFDEPLREVLILADLEQMSAPEIAEALELNLNTVYSRLRTARQRFRDHLRRQLKRRSRPTGRTP